MRHAAVLAFLIGIPLSAQTVRLRSVNGAGGVVTVGSVADTVWLSMHVTHGDLFTIRADSETMAAWADSPTQFNDQAIAFTPLATDSSAYVVHGAQGARRDSIQLPAASAHAVFDAMHGAMPVYPMIGHAFLKFQVTQTATLIPKTRVPDWPEMERAYGVEGDVYARFIVDSTGRVEAPSVTILAAKNSAFENGVRVGLRQMRFHPAEINGRAVAEIVDMGFQFRLPGIINVVTDLP